MRRNGESLDGVRRAMELGPQTLKWMRLVD